MFSLQTQAIEGQPNVIIVSYDTAFARLVVQFLVENGLNVLPLSPESSESDFEQMIDMCQHDIYKVIWIHGFGEEGPTHSHKLIERFQKYKVDVVFVARSSTNFTTKDGIYSHFSSQVNRENHAIDTVFSHFPEAQVFVGVDVYSDEEIPLYPLRLLFLGVSDNTLLDPQIDFHLQTDDEFFNAIKLQILKPHKQEKYQVFGTKVLSCTYVKQCNDLHAQYFGKELEVLPVLSSNAENVLTNNFGLTVYSQEINLTTRLDDLVRRLPEVKKIFKREYKSKEVRESITEPLPSPVKQTHYTPSQTDSKYEYSRLPDSSKTVQNDGLHELHDTQQKTEEMAASELHTKKHLSSPLTSSSKPEKEEDKLEKELKQIFDHNRDDFTTTRKTKKVKKTKKIVKKTKRKKILFFGGLSIIAVGMTSVILYAFFQYSITQVKDTLMAQINPDVQMKNQIDETKWSGLLDSQIEKYESIFEDDLLTDSSVILSLFNGVNAYDSQSNEISDSIGSLYTNILSGGDGIEQQFSDIFSFVKITGQNIELLEGILENISHERFSDDEVKILDEFGKTIAEKRANYSNQANLQAFLPKFFGANEKRTYAVVLQNDQELRPTGGFIQAVALLTFDQGMLIDSQVYNIYDIDNRLPGEITPPDEVKSLLGEENWYLRDGNWDPDFPTTAKNIRWFLQESLGVSVDGVVALNFAVIQDLLKATGPVELPAYNEVITDKNLYERLEFHSRDDLNQGSQNYTTTLFQTVLTALKDLPQDQAIQVVRSLQGSLQEKQLLISLLNKPEASSITNLGWDGGLIEPDCPPQFSAVSCFVDPVYQVETNIGLNKVNTYISRNIKHTVNIQPGKANHQRTIVYKNNAKTDAWPQGTYKSYLRLFVTEPSVVEKALVNGQPVPNNKLVQYVEKDRQVIGILFDVPKGDETKIELVYNTPLEEELPFSYVFFNQRQPGLETKTLQVAVNHPGEYKPKLIAPNAAVEGSTINFSQEIDDIDPNDHFLSGITFK